ncbi:GH36-type glycosyl hydrolase domain-containing protein [Gluconobacter kanchanaburiensis]|uniref:Protein ndvB n=1 Tax=Gluconobacter kanchanaburiensis NBRC 103587 TaxID=1307948 RepID=A0A511B4J9_9PROT|nr:glucoamylase family protein [Gluconobacter kanchanaburiensis]MBF0861721.1 glycosyl transferase [Gluconobacter kanchanaburiensis]GBR67313.1 cyclic beta 1-2 glucan synthetase [Gluconobacter kanchanaburiensis NBRC 103587]GEK95370.1 protein ndvB [Gluconobacter kanchanaburiensis NBRC 103587]
MTSIFRKTVASTFRFEGGKIIRSDILNEERLLQHAASLATIHGDICPGRRSRLLSERLDDNARILLDANIALSQASENSEDITPAGRWLIDNYYLMAAQIEKIKFDLPAGYYKDLPELSSGPFTGLPRAFEIAWVLVSDTDSHIDQKTICQFLNSYQDNRALLIRELWAIPAQIRIVLIENLRRVAEKICQTLRDQKQANTLADTLFSELQPSHTKIMQTLSRIETEKLSQTFLVQFSHRLKGRDPQKDPAFMWLEAILKEKGTDIDRAVHDELQEQSIITATIRNIVTSTRIISTLDWNDVFEKTSRVIHILLRNDRFPEMDAATRNLYSRAVEVLAKGSAHTECEIATRVTSLAAVARQDNAADARRADPGYYLLAEGRPRLEEELGYRAPLRVQVGQICRRLGITGYSLAVTLLTLLFLTAFLALMNGTLSSHTALALVVLGFIPATDPVVATVNRFLMWAIRVSELPELELRNGVTPDLRTIVVVPTLLTRRSSIVAMVRRLEKHYLASRDGEIYFALLTDWTDSATETRKGDQELLDVVTREIAALNRTYDPGSAGTRFILLHRRRQWSQSEGKWIGWERKRGKLHELNRILRGADDTSFFPLPGQSIPQNVRYVVTLDSDTRLPHEVVRRLVGKIAHPLNTARFDPEEGRVVEGYAVLQPRVTPSLPEARQSTMFQRVFSSPNGIEPYTAAVSDLYQDMFAEGSFAGKGIYEIDPFEAALAGRVPDGTLLSHDLFEGVFARAGLVTDIEVIEEYPTDYLVSVARLNRWARGDWQLLPWIFSWMGRFPTIKVRTRPLTGIARWKMLDNLRRSLSAPMSVAALFGGWVLGFHNALVWSLFIVATIAIPAALPLLVDMIRRRRGETFTTYFSLLEVDFVRTVQTTVLCFAFLADQACLMGDAIVRTLIRVFVTRRNLLQWVTAAQAAEAPREAIRGYFLQMGSAVLIGVVATGMMFVAPPADWMIILPFALAWCLSPAIAWKASQYSVSARRLEVSETELVLMRQQARRTWRFFETFVTDTDHMLPPDNFQENPAPLVAHRTSPTNMGLYLLSVVAACDFGWIGVSDAATRLGATLDTMLKLQRFRGHFYNWYSTTDLSPLPPIYVSTVDSGNLAGHLITLASACEEWIQKGRKSDTWREGVRDALTLACEEVTSGRDIFRSSEIPQLLDSLLQDMKDGHASQLTLAHRVQMLIGRAEELVHLRQRRTGQSQGQIQGQNLAGNTASGATGGEDLLFWLHAAQDCIHSERRDFEASATLHEKLATIAASARQLALDMEFAFLRNSDRKLLSIGYVVNEGTLDGNCYDLLASEARLAVFFAIAKGDIQAREWFRLGRPLAAVGHGEALVSWSGSMFEYLMPSLVMAAPFDSLLEETSRQIVRRQVEYGAFRGVPWGISESAYNARDLDYNYQYSDFGVPGLGMRRGLAQDLVIAPYATALATMVDATLATENFKALEKVGAQGAYGFYEALDYTKIRLQPEQPVAVIRSYMAHHQGMSILAIADTVLKGVMRARFHAEPIIGAAELLLQERAPTGGAITTPLREEEFAPPPSAAQVHAGGRHLHGANTETPVCQLLSNGRYSVMLTAAGSGYSRWGDQAVTRWKRDPVLDNWGSYIYLQPIGKSEFWTAALQPCGVPAESYEVEFREDRATYVRQNGNLTTTMEVLVSAEDDAELRRISVRNAGASPIEIDVTSYVELALCPPAMDASHPAFAKMFVQTEYLPASRAILATRRKRNPTEADIWAAHLVVGGGSLSIETDRARFIGRGRDLRTPAALAEGGPLSGSTGTVLDPVFAARCRLTLPARSSRHVSFWTLVASTREALMQGIKRHRNDADLDRALTLAWTHAQVHLRHLDIQPQQADLFQHLAGYLLFPGPALRSSPARIKRGAGRQPDLWGQGVSGDLPILLLVVTGNEDFDLARTVLTAHSYLTLKGLAFDLVILNDHPTSYAQDLQHALEALARSSGENGTVRLLRGGLMSDTVRDLLFSVAAVVLTGKGGSLQQQLTHLSLLRRADTVSGVLPGASLDVSGSVSAGISRGEIRVNRPYHGPQENPALPALEMENGYGGFTSDGTEYAVVIRGRIRTPAPWINVVSSPHFGFQVSAEGSGYTWAENCKENQLTPWSNDPVVNPTGEALYLCDEENRQFWSPLAAVCPDANAVYVCRHGRGYSQFERQANGIRSTLLQYVPPEDPVKISRLTLTNTSAQARTLRVTTYSEWVLGQSRSTTAPFVFTEQDAETGALLVRNKWGETFGEQVAFADLGGHQTSATDDRSSFIGRNGSLSAPRAIVHGGPLSGIVGAGIDPCAALQTVITLEAGESIEIIFLLGQGRDESHARALIHQYRTADLEAVLRDVRRMWDRITGTIQVRTPDRAMDVMLNGWLLYQSLSSRIWTRGGFYQASGAYGFRDQLQDGMSLVLSAPEQVRAHLLRAASRQFPEGDVQHWWLPQKGNGVRTRISDDCAWLAYTVAHYVRVSGDTAVLDEELPFLEAPLLDADEHERFLQPGITDQKTPLYDHCVRALDHSLRRGAHGLPLMGTGDWNDGMNRVGEAGRGESVWLGWFTHAALSAFLPIARARNDMEHVETWTRTLRDLETALEDAWDGAWYRRAYFDDGSPLGSSANREGRIDAIAQSWAVISAAGSPERARQAMQAVWQQLVDLEREIIMVLTPPFDTSEPDPGYIRGYPPGIRENGGQYTHAALWTVMATALLGEGDAAHEMFSTINPVHHARSQEAADRYKVEPYAVVADVYSSTPHVGRGGWSWYTGSAGWMQRVGTEILLGVKIEENRLSIEPHIPSAWPSYEIRLRWKTATYDITVLNPDHISHGDILMVLDGASLPHGAPAHLQDDGLTHRLDCTLMSPNGGPKKSG